MKPVPNLTDAELIEALELAATRARLALSSEIRKAADVIAELALEAADRLRDVLAIAEHWPTKDVLTVLAIAADHLLRDHACDHGRAANVDNARDAAIAIAARISALDAGGREIPASFMPGPLLGRIRDVSIDERGTLTARLEVNDAGAAFMRQIRRAADAPPRDPDYARADLLIKRIIRAEHAIGPLTFQHDELGGLTGDELRSILREARIELEAAS